MDLGSLFLILALALIVGLFVGRPFFERTDALQDDARQDAAAGTHSDDHVRSSLLAERDRTLNALQELEFDFALEKIPAEDYPAQRVFLIQRGAEILKRLDSLRTHNDTQQARANIAPGNDGSPENKPQASSLGSLRTEGMTDQQIEAALSARREAEAMAAGAGANKPSNAADDEDVEATDVEATDVEAMDVEARIEVLLAARRRTRQTRSGGFCPKCGRPVQKTDRFCPKCGNPITGLLPRDASRPSTGHLR